MKLAALVLTVLAVPAEAEKAVQHHILLTEYGNKGKNRLVEVDQTGRMVWQHTPPSTAVVFQVQPNGNVVYGYGGNPTGVREVTKAGTEVWYYVSKCPQVLGFERLANGNTLIAEQGPPQAVEVNAKGEVVRTTLLTTTEKHFHRQVRRVHKLGNGNILAAHEGEGAVREYLPDGKVVWEYSGVDSVFDAMRLPNGHTVISCGEQKRVIEVDRAKQIVWQFTAADGPDLNLAWTTSLQRLRNGNLVIGNFIRGHEGQGAHAFEVTRKKKVVWKWGDHEMVRSSTMVYVMDGR